VQQVVVIDRPQERRHLGVLADDLREDGCPPHAGVSPDAR
jgi:hypothetical protein